MTLPAALRACIPGLVSGGVLLLAGISGFWMLRHAFAQRRNALALAQASEARPEVRWYLFGSAGVLIAAILLAGWLQRPLRTAR
jgi:hypothetical protein